MTSAVSIHRFARNVTRPRSPGPAPTRYTLPLNFLGIDFLVKHRREIFGVLTSTSHNRLPRCCRTDREDLRSQCHQGSLDRCEDADRLIAIGVEQSQKFSLGAKTQTSIEIVDLSDDFPELFVIRANLNRDDALAAGWNKHVPRQFCHKKFRALELRAIAVPAYAKSLQPGAREN